MIQKHEVYIQRCFELARKAIGQTSPNPLVGSVIVKDNIVIGEGYHKESGTDHAEIDAIKNAIQNISGATLYCNLEPCCHINKKTPPCTNTIITSGITEVVISNLDPNPEVSGHGVKLLKEAGIKVTTGILTAEGEVLNEIFFTHITKQRPFIHLKWAQTLDGKIATNTHNSKWITGESARENVHKERNLYDAIMIGANTANQDDPSLTIRLNYQTSCKKRIVLAPSGKVTNNLKIFQDEFKDNTLLVTNSPENFPVDTMNCPLKDNELDLDRLLKDLYHRGICSVYVEGGTKLLNSFLTHKVYDRISVYIAPKLLGQGLSPYYGPELSLMKDSLSFNEGIWTNFDKDMLFQNKRNLCLQA